MSSLQIYHILNLWGWLAGFGVIISFVGIIPAAALFILLWVNNRSLRAGDYERKLLADAEAEQARLETEHIRSDPDRFGTDPTRTRYI